MSDSPTRTRHETLVAYLLSSVESGDWHAVRDAAADLEILKSFNDGYLAASREITHDKCCGCRVCKQFAGVKRQ